MFTITSLLSGLPDEQKKKVKGNNIFLPRFFFRWHSFLTLCFRRMAQEVEKATWLVLNMFSLKTWELDNRLCMWVCASASHLLSLITLLKINHLVERTCLVVLFSIIITRSSLPYWPTEGTNAMWALCLITWDLNLKTHISRNPRFFWFGWSWSDLVSFSNSLIIMDIIIILTFATVEFCSLGLYSDFPVEMSQWAFDAWHSFEQIWGKTGKGNACRQPGGGN